MSNIKPFLSRGFNLRIWEQLQRYVQEVAHDYGSVYVYTGSIYLPREVKCSSWYLEFQPEDTSLVAVPTHFFKVLIIEPSRRDNAPYAESYVLPNLNIKDNLDLRMLLCDLRDIENATGLKFFDGLDRNFVNTQPVQQPSGSQTIACN
ncbi:endonuclease G, mitochondrial [Drosophila busckii]|uniref:endonuclease G, mitochondrial n=1 Tax=Drosophila busckii TaxID=30019 RepID=UPI00083F486B|nr:endonuclease G, mitochondrial [Drosophila busckii]